VKKERINKKLFLFFLQAAATRGSPSYKEMNNKKAGKKRRLFDQTRKERGGKRVARINNRICSAPL